MVTMKDVAQEAGVSRPTVSLVLNGRDSAVRISAATREHILKAADKLGYRRNELATSVKTGKTNVIGFVGGINEEYVMKIINGINSELAANSYLLKMMSTEWGQVDVSPLARQCVERMVSGVICRSLTEEQLEIMRQELEPRNIPVVLVDSSFSHDWCPRIVSDDHAGEIMAVRHLYELGHRRIGHITAREQSGFVTLRKAGFEQGMEECGLDCSEENFVYIDKLEEVTADTIGCFEKLVWSFKPTAVVCSSDPIAMKFLQWAYNQKIKIPDDISVVGFANLALTQYAAPALTTIAQPFNQMGQQAARKVLGMIKNEATGDDEALSVKLIRRESTATASKEP
jgi:DNA-binding LacI/PurR family transcriptional regulator